MIGKKIKEAFDKSGYTVEELSQKMGVTKASVYNWFKKDSIDTKLLEDLSKLFGVSIGYFFFDDYEEKSNAVDGEKEALKEQVKILRENNKFLQNTLSKVLESKGE